MKVILNKSAKSCMETSNIVLEKLDSLSKYLSEDAVLSLSLKYKGKQDEASLNIVDRGMHVYAKDENILSEVAIYNAIKKCAIQIVKIKDKNLRDRGSFKYNEVDLDANVIDVIDFCEAEEALKKKKKTSRYQRTIDKYVNSLNVSLEYEKNGNHLETLTSIEENQIDTMLHKDYLLLQESIQDLCHEYCDLVDEEAKFYQSQRDQKYVEEAIDDELNLLKKKRKIK